MWHGKPGQKKERNERGQVAAVSFAGTSHIATGAFIAEGPIALSAVGASIATGASIAVAAAGTPKSAIG